MAVGVGVGVLADVTVGVAVGTGVCVAVEVAIGTDVAACVGMGVAVSVRTAVGGSSARVTEAGVAVAGGVSSPHEVSRAPKTPAIRNAPNVCGLKHKRFTRFPISTRTGEILGNL